jgi:hypothetical protein
MFIRLHQKGLIKNFNVWAYGDNVKGLVRGSGLFVDKTGASSYHHFLLPKKEIDYQFLAGEYILQVYVETVNKKPKNIFEQILILPGTLQQENKFAICFDWEADRQEYFTHLETERNLKNLNWVELFR